MSTSTFTLSINNVEIGTFTRTLAGAQAAARVVQDTHPEHAVVLRRGRGKDNVARDMLRVSLLQNALFALNKSTLVMATGDAGQLVPVVRGPGGLLMI